MAMTFGEDPKRRTKHTRIQVSHAKVSEENGTTAGAGVLSDTAWLPVVHPATNNAVHKIRAKMVVLVALGGTDEEANVQSW